MSDWDALYSCPVCETEDCVLPSGPENSPILIIGAFPGDEEIKHGKPMVGANGGILRTELGKNSIDMKRCRITNLWMHKPNNNAGCLVNSVKHVIKDAKGKKAILLIGAETVKYFCNCSVEDYNGLLVKSDYLRAPVVMACIQPASVFHGSAGEFKLSISKFGKKVEELGLL